MTRSLFEEKHPSFPLTGNEDFDHRSGAVKGKVHCFAAPDRSSVDDFDAGTPGKKTCAEMEHKRCAELEHTRND